MSAATKDELLVAPKEATIPARQGIHVDPLALFVVRCGKDIADAVAVEVGPDDDPVGRAASTSLAMCAIAASSTKFRPWRRPMTFRRRRGLSG